MVKLVKHEDGKKAYIGILSNEEIEAAEKLLEELINYIPLLEDELEVLSGSRIEYAHAYGTKLSELLNEHEVKEYQRKIFFQEIRHFASQEEDLPKDRSESREVLEYYYRISQYPLEDVKLINWSEWSQLLDIPAISKDDRIILWLLKVSKEQKISRDIFRELVTGLRLYTKNKDLSFLTPEQLNEKLSTVLNLSINKFNLYKTYFTNRNLEPSKARLKQKKKYREKYFTDAFHLVKTTSGDQNILTISEVTFIKVYNPPPMDLN